MTTPSHRRRSARTRGGANSVNFWLSKGPKVGSGELIPLQGAPTSSISAPKGRGGAIPCPNRHFGHSPRDGGAGRFGLTFD